MKADEMDATVALLLSEAEGELGDVHEFRVRLALTLAQMRAMGMPAPADLVRLEREIESLAGAGTPVETTEAAKEGD